MADGGKITLSITPRPIPLLTKFNILVDIESLEANSITVDFQGTTMNMGLNRVDLKSNSKNQFWSYSFSVEYLLTKEESIINNIFDRINRNVAKLTSQELRHAKFSGDFI